MKKMFFAAAITVVLTTTAMAQQFQFAGFQDVETAFASHEAQLEELDARLAAFEDVMVDPVQAVAGPDAACCCCDCWCNPCCGWIGSVELLLLRPQDSEFDSPAGTDLQTGSRWTIGRIDNCGRSWRARYFEFHHDDFDGGALSMEMADIEYAARFELGCNWRGELSAGLRWAAYRDNNNEYTESIGPVLGAEIRNQLWCDVDIFALGRTSHQFGEPNNGPGGAMSITELQVGVEVVRCVGGTEIFARTVMESQYWIGPEDGGTDDVGLIGLGFAVGLAR